MIVTNHPYPSIHMMIQGSGKSYTMMGSAEDEILKGIIPRLCDTLFARIDQVCVLCMATIPGVQN